MQNNFAAARFAYVGKMLSIARIYISPGHNFFGRHGLEAGTHPTLSISEVECVAGKGLTGDRFFGYKDDYAGQVTFFAWETYEDLCRQLGVTDKDPGVFRRNIVTRGADLNSLIGKEFEIQGVSFSGAKESTPCDWMDSAFAPGAKDAMLGRGGLRARILTNGLLRVDESAA
jgi:MOSC domain-containing protein YiiM